MEAIFEQIRRYIDDQCQPILALREELVNTERGKAPLLVCHMGTVFQAGTTRENPFRIGENGMAHGPVVPDMKGASSSRCTR